eukprot:g44320.t1
MQLPILPPTMSNVDDKKSCLRAGTSVVPQGKGMVGKWEVFRNEKMRVKGQYVPASVMSRAEEEMLDILKYITMDKSLGPDQVYPTTCGKL